MFIETITSPRDDYERWNSLLRTVDDPPAGLIASIAWDSDDGNVTVLNTWETPAAVADHYMDRVRPIVESEGEPANKPDRHGAPVHFWIKRD